MLGRECSRSYQRAASNLYTPPAVLHGKIYHFVVGKDSTTFIFINIYVYLIPGSNGGSSQFPMEYSSLCMTRSES